MSKLHAAIFLGAIGLVGATGGLVFAQQATTDQRGACSQDYAKYCVGTEPGGGRVVACLNKQHDRLSAACKKAIDSHKK